MENFPVAPGDPRRYFSLGYDYRGNTCIMSLPNGIAVICLASEHPVLAEKLTVISVDFKVSS
jgi:hypothetical protein